jgi:hypothetical protein
VGGEHLCCIRRSLPEILPAIVVEALRADLGVPQNGEVLALGVIGNA